MTRHMVAIFPPIAKRKAKILVFPSSELPGVHCLPRSGLWLVIRGVLMRYQTPN